MAAAAVLADQGQAVVLKIDRRRTSCARGRGLAANVRLGRMMGRRRARRKRRRDRRQATSSRRARNSLSIIFAVQSPAAVGEVTKEPVPLAAGRGYAPVIAALAFTAPPAGFD